VAYPPGEVAAQDGMREIGVSRHAAFAAPKTMKTEASSDRLNRDKLVGESV
jgi:hypothetical protein